jgi:hypothetical protein
MRQGTRIFRVAALHQSLAAVVQVGIGRSCCDKIRQYFAAEHVCTDFASCQRARMARRGMLLARNLRKYHSPQRRSQHSVSL